MTFKNEFVQAVSQKTGKEYYAIDIEIAPGYRKRVFLTASEVALIQIQQQK